ncbi:hypothetical protein SY88_11390 [Clostridiales bacterium PH28_bin88]|nr:hypothetical protein SY88_11390 [Clostridiales bacterium PH28_bin88]
MSFPMSFFLEGEVAVVLEVNNCVVHWFQGMHSFQDNPPVLGLLQKFFRVSQSLDHKSNDFDISGQNGV